MPQVAFGITFTSSHGVRLRIIDIQQANNDGTSEFQFALGAIALSRSF